jgi:hypothetical protein
VARQFIRAFTAILLGQALKPATTLLIPKSSSAFVHLRCEVCQCVSTTPVFGWFIEEMSGATSCTSLLFWISRFTVLVERVDETELTRKGRLHAPRATESAL